jgi:hypothetical protein
MMTATSMEKRLLCSYLRRKAAEQQEIIDTSAVFGKRYGAAVDELEEISDLLQSLTNKTIGRSRNRD